MEGGQKKHQKPHHPHHQVPKHESGYTDEAAEECHDLIDNAEEQAHVSKPPGASQPTSIYLLRTMSADRVPAP